MNYDSIIKRVQKAIETAKNRDSPVCVHKVNINDDIDTLSGLVVIYHPNFTEGGKA